MWKHDVRRIAWHAVQSSIRRVWKFDSNPLSHLLLDVPESEDLCVFAYAPACFFSPNQISESINLIWSSTVSQKSHSNQWGDSKWWFETIQIKLIVQIYSDLTIFYLNVRSQLFIGCYFRHFVHIEGFLSFSDGKCYIYPSKSAQFRFGHPHPSMEGLLWEHVTWNPNEALLELTWRR